MKTSNTNYMYILLGCESSQSKTFAIDWFRKGLIHARNRINDNPISQTIEQLDREIESLGRHLNKKKLN